MTGSAGCGCKSGISWELGAIGQSSVDTGYLHIPSMAVWRMCNKCVIMHLLWVGKHCEGEQERCLCFVQLEAACRVCSVCTRILCGIVCVSVSGVWVRLFRTLPVAAC